MAVKEIKSLTGIRGFAALYVMCYHWYETTFISNSSFPNYKNSFSLIILGKIGSNLLQHGYLAVDLFFGLSGFVLSLNSQKNFRAGVSLSNYMNFMLKRFFRIFPLYIAITLLYYFAFHQAEIVTLVINLTLLQTVIPRLNVISLIPPGWSLTNEWVFYFFFPFMLWFLLKIKRQKWVIFGAAFLILAIICSYRSQALNWTNYPRLEFLHGFYPRIDFTRGPSSWLRTLVAYILGVFAYLQFKKYKHPYIIQYSVWLVLILLLIPGTDVLVALLIPFVIWSLTIDNIISRFLSSQISYFLGIISFSIYVNHYLFIFSYPGFSRLIGKSGNVFSFLYIFLGTLILSVLTYYAIEKVGMKTFKVFKNLISRNHDKTDRRIPMSP